MTLMIMDEPYLRVGLKSIGGPLVSMPYGSAWRPCVQCGNGGWLWAWLGLSASCGKAD